MRTSTFLSCRVQSNPENAPAIDFEAYKKNCSNKDVVDKLKSAYASFKVPYPTHNLNSAVDEEAAAAKADAKRFAEITAAQIKEAEEYKSKFESMIPLHEMTVEEFYLTFPQWAVYRRDKPTVWPHDPRTIGLTREQIAELEHYEYADLSKDPLPAPAK